MPIEATPVQRSALPNAGNKRNGEPNVWQAPDDAFAALGLSPDKTDPRQRCKVVVFALDRAIGRALAALDAADCTNNTFVLFMSDNGAFRLSRHGLDVGLNDPLRAGGVTCWKGGLRVAAMVRWPGQIARGSVIAEPFWSPDVFIACSILSGAALPPDTVFDGKNPLPLLTDAAPTPHESLFLEYRQHAALRKGDWKIVREHPEQDWQLFDLRHDEQESRNLASDRPEKVDELRSAFRAWKAGFARRD